MGRFARSAGKWLNVLFLPSYLPARDPEIRSDDVQLVELYSGGGYSMFENSEWFSTVNAILTNTVPEQFTLGTQPVNQVTRLLGASVSLDVVPATAVTLWLEVLPTGSVGTVVPIVISDRITGILDTERRRFAGLPPILGPEHRILMLKSAGLAAGVTATIVFYFVSAPRGVSFHV